MDKQGSLYRRYGKIGLGVVGIVFLVLLTYYGVKNGVTILQTVWGGIAGFLDVMSPIIYAFAIAYILYKPVCAVERKLQKIFLSKGNEQKSLKTVMVRILSMIIVFVIVAIALMLLLYFLVPPIVENVDQLLKSKPELMGIIEKIVSNETLAVIEDTEISIESIMESVISLVSNVGPMIIDIIATMILAFYFLKDKENLFFAIDRFADVIFSPKVKRHVKVVVWDIDEIIGGFVIGTLLAGILVALISTSLMLLIGHPFALLIGVIAGLANVIPYIGPLIGAALALVLGLLDSVTMGITGCVVLLIYQQIDGNFIEPKVVGDKIGLPAVWILITVIIGGSYFGGVGMILSAPVAALIKVYINRAYDYKLNRGMIRN